MRAAGWSAGLRFAHDLPWLAVARRERLTGPAPVAPRPGAAALACTDDHIVLWGAAETEAGVPALSTIHLLDREGWRWATPALQRDMPALQGQAAVGVGCKLVGMGGQGLAGLLHGVHFLPTATRQWVAAPMGADGGAGAAPAPRWGHALAYCPQRSCLYVFGGCGASGDALGDLWALHLADMCWQDLGSQPTSRQGANLAASPVPRVNAAMACSPDGLRLWLFGGAEPGDAEPGGAGAAGGSGSSRRCLGDLAFFDLASGGWTAVEAGAAGGTCIEPREGHAMTSIGRFLLVVGGCGRGRDGRRGGLADTWAFDTHGGTWDRLDDAAWQGAAGSSGSSRAVDGAADAVPCVSLIDDGSAAIERSCSRRSDRWPDRSCSDTQQPWLGADTCCFDATGRLHILQPAPTAGMLCNLTIIELTLPDEVEARRAAHATAHARVERLELVAEAEHVTSTSFRVRWVEPSALRDRRLGFKLFLTSLEGLQGRTREVYQASWQPLSCDASFSSCPCCCRPFEPSPRRALRWPVILQVYSLGRRLCWQLRPPTIMGVMPGLRRELSARSSAEGGRNRKHLPRVWSSVGCSVVKVAATKLSDGSGFSAHRTREWTGLQSAQLEASQRQERGWLEVRQRRHPFGHLLIRLLVLLGLVICR